ncbi:MAG: hypothetical protein ACRDRK_24560 [Pseudonocardia sp.]
MTFGAAGALITGGAAVAATVALQHESTPSGHGFCCIAQGARLQATMITVSARFRPDPTGECARLVILSLDEAADVLQNTKDFCGEARHRGGTGCRQV